MRTRGHPHPIQRVARAAASVLVTKIMSAFLICQGATAWFQFQRPVSSQVIQTQNTM